MLRNVNVRKPFVIAIIIWGCLSQNIVAAQPFSITASESWEETSEVDIGNLNSSVVLFEGLRSGPALPRLIGNFVYYTSATSIEIVDTKNGCRGKGIYRISLEDKVETKVSDIDCVVDLIHDKASAYVIHRDNGELILSKVTEVSVTPEINAELAKKIRAALGFKRASLKLPPGKPFQFISYAIHNERLLILAQLADTKSHLFSIWIDKNTKTPDSKSIQSIPFPGRLHELALLSDGSTLIGTKLEDGETKFGRLIQINFQENTARSLGTDAAMGSESNEGSSEQLSIRTPRLLRECPGGALVADLTPFLFSETRSLFFYSTSTNRYQRSNISAQDISGVEWTHNGLLVARAQVGKIIWYGTGNPFLKTNVEVNQ